MMNAHFFANPMPRRLTVLANHVYTRLLLAAGWTLLVTVMLVQSSSQPIVGAPAPPGKPDLWREIELTSGHVVVFALLVLLWWWALSAKLPPPRALFVAVGFALIFGTITELAQTALSDRQASFFDMAVNWTVTIMTATFLSERWRVRLSPLRPPLAGSESAQGQGQKRDSAAARRTPQR
jgi:VanZ family protein